MKKIVLITGASKGIGHALAKKILEAGYYLIGTSRDGNISGFEGKDFYALKLDLTDSSSIKEAQELITNKFQQIDIFINNAGIGPDLGFSKPEKASFDLTFDVNVSGLVFFTEPLIDLIPQGGMLLNISSKMGAIGACEQSGSVAYRMSKSALNMYSKILTNRLAGKVKVASIHPGWVKTTIMEGNMENARLTAEESANRIYDFLSKDFQSGIFWDAEDGVELGW